MFFDKTQLKEDSMAGKKKRLSLDEQIEKAKQELEKSEDKAKTYSERVEHWKKELKRLIQKKMNQAMDEAGLNEYDIIAMVNERTKKEAEQKKEQVEEQKGQEEGQAEGVK